MAFKVTLALCGLVLAIQTACAQYYGGNSVVENNVVVNSGASNAYGSAGGLGGAVGVTSGFNNGLGLGLGSGLGFGNGLAGVEIVGAGLGGLGYNNGLGLGAGLGLSNVVFGGPSFIDIGVISGGGVLPISSFGPVVPAGLTVVSDNAIEGAVLVSGQLPFLSAAAFEGALASAGSGAASYVIGNGNIGIISESGSASLLPAASGIGLGAGLGLGLGGLGGVGGLGEVVSIGGIGGLGGLGGFGGVGGLGGLGGLGGIAGYGGLVNGRCGC